MPVSFSQTHCPHLFPKGFSVWPGKLVPEYYFTDSPSRFCSPSKNRMQQSLSSNSVLTSICPFCIVKRFRYDQRTRAESHFTLYMFFPCSRYQLYILILVCLVCTVNHRMPGNCWASCRTSPKLSSPQHSSGFWCTQTCEWTQNFPYNK